MTALVTGGGGFLGGAVVRRLLARGGPVRSFTRSNYPWLTDLGVQQVNGDLTNADDVRRAVSGCGVVYHVAAKAGVWGRPADFFSTNVTGTRNVLAACRAEKVTRLVYTSTPSVVHTGGDICGANESLPYATRFDSPYPESKAIAEKEVLAANGSELATVALRPHLVWGPGDPHLIPRILTRARAGKLLRIGTRPLTVDVTYIDNAADAHLCAADRLAPGAPPAGKAYFISNGEPVNLWEFINKVLALAGVAPVNKAVRVWVAKLAGRWMERFHRWFGLSGEPAMTRFMASQLSTSHWYDISAARRDLGYCPKVSIDDGLCRLAESFRRG